MTLFKLHQLARAYPDFDTFRSQLAKELGAPESVKVFELGIAIYAEDTIRFIEIQDSLPGVDINQMVNDNFEDLIKP